MADGGDEELRTAAVGQYVWVEGAEGAFFHGEIMEKLGDGVSAPVQYKVKLQGKNNTVHKQMKELLGSNEKLVPSAECHDLTKLVYTHDAAVLDMLKQRYAQSLIYTYVSHMLVVINPFRELYLTTPENVMRYRHMNEEQLMNLNQKDPHLYGMCSAALRTMMDDPTQPPRERKDLSFVISGESGAGKTETTKHIMQFFTTPDDGSSPRDPTAQAIMAANAILESFGCAMTVRNNNSSRYGRLVNLYLDVTNRDGVPVPKVLGAKITSYLLEKSRVTHAAPNERSYHIFYQMCKAKVLEDENALKDDFGIRKPWKDLNYLCGPRKFDLPPRADERHRNIDVEGWADVLKGFNAINLDTKDQESVERILATILLLGEIELKASSDPDGRVETKNRPSLLTIADVIDNLRLVGAEDVYDEDSNRRRQAMERAGGVGLFNALVTKYITVNNDVQEKYLKLQDAQSSINTVARMIYTRLFEWLITKINDASKLLDDSDKVRTLGILDIFGFEIVETNNLEQLLINYANERLQQFYVQASFQLEQEEYRKEGIDTACIKYSDNNTVIALLDNVPKPNSSEKPGILERLGDVCKVEIGTDEQFINSVKETSYPPDLFAWGKGPKEKEVFSVNHTAAKVTYTVIKFREKNMETLEKKVIDVLSDTRDRVMKEVFPRTKEVDKKESSRFMHAYLKESMTSLLDVLGDTMPYFIRCVKPNETKLPNNFNNKVTLTQLKSLSILDALYLAQNGYPHRWDYDTFLDRLHILRKVYRPSAATPEDMCNEMLEKIGVPQPGYQMGKSMIFLKKKTYRMLGDKTDLVMQACYNVGEDIVRVSKRKRVKEDFDDSVRRLINIQAYARGFRERLIISKMLKRKRFLWGALLFGFRYRRFKRDRLAAFTIQTTIRELKAMATLHEKIKEKRLRTSRHRLKTFVQVLLSQRSLQMSIEDRHRRKLFDCVEKVAKLWVQRENLRRFWTWRALMLPAKREVHRRKLLIAKLQAAIRGLRVRRSQLGYKVKGLTRKVKEKFKDQQSSIALQRQSKGYLMLRRFTDMHWAATAVQFYMGLRMDRADFVMCRQQCVRIQSVFRGWLTRAIISWQKLIVLYGAERAQYEKLGLQARRKMFDIVGVKPLSLVYMTCGMDIRPFYPQGWLRGYEDLVKRDGVVKMQVGAEHTVVLGQNALYAWGSDEVGQLGIGATAVKHRNAAKTFGLVVPFFRYKVMDIACGRWHTVAHVEGKDPVYCWGLNHRGQCGLKQYMPGAAFTPSYPKMVRTPASLAVMGPVKGIAAGPFHSGMACGDPAQAYVWGEGNACGQGRDVRVPLKVAPEAIKMIALGDHFGLIVEEHGVSAFGVRSALLGIGAYPKKTKRENAGLVVVQPLVRFDTQEVSTHAKLVAVPVPVRLPKTQIASVCVGEDHCIALTRSMECYEWGVRNIVKTEPVEDVGLVHLATPMKLELARCREIRAAGNLSAVSLDSPGVVVAWSFVETTSRVDMCRPALVSFRMLRNASRIEMCGSASITLAYGYSTQWKEPDLERVLESREVSSPTRGRGGQPSKQPLSPAVSPQKGRLPRRETMGTSIAASTSPVTRLRSSSPANRSPRGQSPGAKFGLSPGPGSRSRGATPTKAITMGGPAESEPIVGDRPPVGSPGAGASSPSPRGRPAFFSPTFAGRGSDPPKLKDQSPFSPRAQQSPRSPRGGSPSPQRGGGGGAASLRPADLIQSFGSGAEATDNKSKYMFEIQHLLRGRSRDELEQIARQLRS